MDRRSERRAESHRKDNTGNKMDRRSDEKG